MDPEDRQALRAIMATFEQLEKHGDRLRDYLYPERGSALALADDDLPRPIRLSQHVWGALAATHDHLSCLALTIEARRGFTGATGSLARSGMVGAAHALWLMAPDDVTERRDRTIAFSREWLYRRMEWQTSVLPDLDPASQPQAAEQLKLFQSDLDDLQARRVSSPSLRPTDVVTIAAELTFEDLEARREVLANWRRLSGDAHALGWSAMMQSATWGAKKPDGTTEVIVEGSMGLLASSYLGAWHMFERAWGRLWQLCEVVPTGNDLT